VPIATSDPVTYTVSAVLMARMKVDYHGQDTATVVIAVGVGDINLAFRKPATESSTYTYSIPVNNSCSVLTMIINFHPSH
jgi:hypothetical protein